MALQVPPNGSGSVIDTQTTVSPKERQVVIPAVGAQWKLFNTPVAATQATITQTAGAAGVSNVCQSISASLCTVGTAQAAVVQLNLRDGATGAGTVLWSKSFSLGTTTMISVDITGLYIVGSAATAMTLEFSAAGVAASFESVSIVGCTTA